MIGHKSTEGSWSNSNQNSHSIFVDNLPVNISKRFLYREFGFHGQVTDVFISRKPREGKNSVFAFIRYDSRGGAVRAMEKLNGTFIAGKEIVVKDALARGARTQKMRWKWVRKESGTKAIPEADNVERDMEHSNPKVVTKSMKAVEVEVKVSEEQSELLNRSIIAECFKPIKFGIVVEQFDKLELQYGKIECRDFGPKKCILSMDSVELRDRALAESIFTGIFDEVRSYWG
ncbi:hypothetical protein PIB30_038542 [Stylosanthes scabra]|uniref:RRM domain-containing protein n=1 Tax=Stylosanthes scabra TaxID=79078 RepID=A0ABU6XCW0_9FABA|nr:hypothetical protein [Stylosanthes scabra]